LLQKALENFLETYLDENGEVISDEKGDIIIGKDIKKPFSKSSLLIQLENIEDKKAIKNFNYLANEKNDIKIELSFEEKLDNLIEQFASNLKILIKEHYDKK